MCRLLDILADRKSSSRVSGSVLVNGRLREDNFRFKTGYVVQVQRVLYYIHCICTVAVVWYFCSFLANQRIIINNCCMAWKIDFYL